MATEYKLSYTASEIDEKLGKIDSLATTTYVDSKDSEILADAKIYTNDQIASIPAPDVSSDIDAHDSSTTAHADIREQIEQLSSVVASKEQLTPEFANNIEECTDTTKLYVLPDGYIYAYMTKSVTTQAPELFDRSACTLNARYSGTPGSVVARNGYYITDFIPVDMSISDPVVLRFKGGTLWKQGGDGDKLMLFDADKNTLKTTFLYDGFRNQSAYGHYVEADGDDYTVKLGYTCYPRTSTELTKDEVYNQIAYIRINHGINISGTALTVNNIPDVSITIDAMGGIKVETGWLNTGHAFIPAYYEDRIIAVENLAESNAKKIANINGENSVTTVPSYWNNSVNTVVSTVKAIQDEGGNDVVNFMWFSDMHYASGNQYVANLGSLCSAVMSACDIPLTISSGDTLTAGIASSEDQLLGWLSDAVNVLAPIGIEKLLIARGNHDDVYGSYTTDGETKYYVNKANSKKVWNVLHRAQATDFRRVYGTEGTYFYIDNVAQRTRFIVLDCQRYGGDGYSNGTSGAMTSGYGQTQLDWFANEALLVERQDWSIVIVQHIPPTAQTVNGNTYYLSQIAGGDLFRGIVTAYCNKSNYSGSYSGTEYQTADITVDYTNKQTSDVIGIFCGHCHADAVVTNDLPCPIFTITCAINTPYDGTASDRVAGTDTETAIDVVSINKAARTVMMTRLGAGDNRNYSY